MRRSLLPTILSLLVLNTILTKDVTKIQTDTTIQSDFKVNSLKVSKEKETLPEIKFESDRFKSKIAAEDKKLTFSKESKPFLDITPKSITTPDGTSFYMGINIEKDLVVNNKRQWMLAYRTDFANFSDEVKYTCGPYNMLGGYCISSGKDLRQKFILPKHQFLRVKANYHFLDGWNGETGYLKVNFIF